VLLLSLYLPLLFCTLALLLGHTALGLGIFAAILGCLTSRFCGVVGFTGHAELLL
jgi:hypothetical protein